MQVFVWPFYLLYYIEGKIKQTIKTATKSRYKTAIKSPENKARELPILW